MTDNNFDNDPGNGQHTLLILAAGRGTRMHSDRPKVLQTLAGKPLLAHVLTTCGRLNAAQTLVVQGFGGDLVQAAFAEYHDIKWIAQTEQLGTAHAVKMALPALPSAGKTLILAGDVPLVQAETLQKLLSDCAPIAMLTLAVADPTGFGRIVRDEQNNVIAIREQKDANERERAINEINSGIYAVDNALLHQYLPKINNNNAQKEYYLTDLIALAVADGQIISTHSPKFAFEIDGVNDRVQLATLERTWQAHLVGQLQQRGVQFSDPSRVDIRGELSCGRDVFIDVNCVFSGRVSLGDNVVIDAGNVIDNATIGNACHIKPYCVISDSSIGNAVDIGPFAHLRPQTALADRTKIGNFVEVKKAQIGPGSKVNHLSYIGDATIGGSVNVGAGVITCNYDGVNKSRTVIGDGAFIGSNASLVAPVMVGDDATIGAGSVIAKDAPSGKLTLTRAAQYTSNNWTRPIKKTD